VLRTTKHLITRWLAFFWIALVLSIAVVGAMASWSPSGWVILAASLFGAATLLDERAPVRRALAGVAAAMLVGLVLVRMFRASGPSARLLTLPGGASSRWMGRLVDEQDVALIGARVLSWRWPMVDDERNGLVHAMRDAYVDMRSDVGLYPSPVIDTLWMRQSPSAFDALVFESTEQASSDRTHAGVIFLHGYGGSFALECWLVARAARAIRALTVCPAVGFNGRWIDADGERTLRATLDYVHDRGIRRVYLAGLSNGAVGAAAMASRFASSLSGLVLISGAPATGTNGGLPTLVVHGESDPICSASAAHAYALSNHAIYAGFPGGHFVLLMRRAETSAAIESWLSRCEERR
jgi:pimeloyl-ACP methyl ester carboxylesterase